MDRLRAVIESLIPEVDSVRAIRYGSDIDWYDSVTRASLTKAFDFAYWAIDGDKPPGISFWAVGTLRGIVEEIIVLAALRRIPQNDRDKLLSSWMLRDVLDGLRKQTAFFSTTDRLQSVLTPPSTVDDDLAELQAVMQEIWKTYGFKPGVVAKGNIRNLAERSDLHELYDFLYALTSRLVHFSPSILLRSGWGNYIDNELVATFRAANFDAYYKSFIVNYSMLLLTEFIERLGDSISLSDEFKHAAQSIRDELVHVRMPELVTYEEMNVPPPGIILRVFETMIRSGEATIQQAQHALELLADYATNETSEH